MTEDKKGQVDSETILITLDQIGQTIDIMTDVVGRLRHYITEQTVIKETPDKYCLSSHEPNDSQKLH